MSGIVRQLVYKDMQIMKVPIISWWLGALLAVVIVLVGGEGMGLAGMILFLTAMAGAGVHAVMQTVVEERREQTLPFIMSLPITIREYTTAKLIANLLIFGVVWVTLAPASLVLFIDGLPDGTLPFVAIILVGIFLAYTIVLATSLVTESIGYAIGATVVANIGTQLYIWQVVELHGIRSVMGGPVAVWNTTAVTILAVQILAIVGLLGFTFVLQARKKDFV